MAIRYAIENWITDDTDLYSSSEDDLYIKENVYNRRPSKPFRFQGIGLSSGDIPEWICVDLGVARRPTFTGIFNHNIQLSQSGDEFMLKGCSEGCPTQSGACDWDASAGSGGPECTVDLSGRIIENWRNSCRSFDCGLNLQYWRLQIIDAGNLDGYIEIGEWFLGEIQTFSNARLQPGRSDGPVFFEGSKITYMGQIWSNYYSEAEEFSITIKSMNNPLQVDELRLFLSAVKQNAGKFVFIPNDNFPFCYYVYMTNMAGFGQQLVKGLTCEHYEWKIDLRTLVSGIILLD